MGFNPHPTFLPGDACTPESPMASDNLFQSAPDISAG